MKKFLFALAVLVLSTSYAEACFHRRSAARSTGGCASSVAVQVQVAGPTVVQQSAASTRTRVISRTRSVFKGSSCATGGCATGGCAR